MVIEVSPPELLDAGFGALYEVIRPLLLKVSFLVGGIFGLYLILILVRVYYERKKVKLLQGIRYDLDRLNIHYGLSYSKQRKGFLKRTLFRIREKFRHRMVRYGLKKIKKNKK